MGDLMTSPVKMAKQLTGSRTKIASLAHPSEEEDEKTERLINDHAP
jgi:hypothetical protein